MARFLVCFDCKTIDRMGDHEGSVDRDFQLHETIQRHLKTSDRGDDPAKHKSQIFAVPGDGSAFADMEQAERALTENLANAGVFIKETRDGLKVEALQCYNRHNRPTKGCIDWKDRSKKIGRHRGVPDNECMYLCEFCPAKAHYDFQARQAQGMYGK
jgi:hypothetical protein